MSVADTGELCETVRQATAVLLCCRQAGFARDPRAAGQGLEHATRLMSEVQERLPAFQRGRQELLAELRGFARELAEAEHLHRHAAAAHLGWLEQWMALTGRSSGCYGVPGAAPMTGLHRLELEG